MPTNTADQQIPLPVDADVADNPVAFANFVSLVEPRLVRLYTDEADRTTRQLVVAENELSGLATENRVEVYNGSANVSLYSRSLYAFSRVSADQLLTISNTTLQDVTNMVVSLPGVTGAIFGFRGIVFYDSAAAADIKFAFTIPAAATMRWGLEGLASGTAGISGDATRPYTTVSATALTAGGAGVGTGVWAAFQGEVTMGVTAGNLQLQAAQNASDATQTTISTRSRIEAWRIS